MISATCSPFFRLFLALGLILGLSSLAHAQSADVEPNSVCAEAQELGEITAPLVIYGGLNPVSGLVAIETPVDSSSDDAEESPTGSVSLTSTELELGASQTIGIRFRGVNIPPGATIVKASVQLQAIEIDTDPVTLTIAGEAAVDAATFASSDNDVSSRATTDAIVPWTPAPWVTVGDAGRDERTTDIAPVVQEIVDQTGWESGNAVALIITASETEKRVAGAFDSAAAAAAKLHVEYRTSADAAGQDVSDVDFFELTGEAGSTVRVDYVADNVFDDDDDDDNGPGNPEGATFVSTLLGLFDSDCNLLESAEGFGGDSSVTLQFEIPDDGAFILAASGYSDDAFTGQHRSGGAYQITIATSNLLASSVSGRVADAVTDEPVPGRTPTFAEVDLYQCVDSSCSYHLDSLKPNKNGRFRFKREELFSPFDAGFYQLVAGAADYELTETKPFEVGEDEDLDVGDILLTRPPLQLSDAVPCTDLPPQGGTCRYSVTLTSSAQTEIEGMAWSVVETTGLAGPVYFNEFQAGSHSLRLAPGESEVVSFEFSVPGGVDDSASVCTRILASQGPKPLSGPWIEGSLFCIEKAADGGFSVVTDPQRL